MSWSATGTRAAGLALGLVLLAGCSQSMRAGMRTLSASWQPQPVLDVPKVELNPQLRYLRVQIDSARGPQVALMVEGDQDVGPGGDLTSVWYGADGTVLRLREGRLVGFADARQAWRVIDEEAPGRWPGVSPSGDERAASALAYTQVIDMQPGHQFGLPRRRELVATDAPPADHTVQGATGALRWVMDRPMSQDPAGNDAPGWYALDDRSQPAQVLYGQRCLDNRICLRWQHWPPR